MRLSEVAKASSISALPKDEQQQLVARKKKARRYSQIGGTLGLAALATRAPQGVKAATAHTPALRVRRPVRRLIAWEPRATNASNTLTTLGAGIGAMGSFNFAGMQRSEAKADEKQIKVRKRDEHAGRKVAGAGAGLSAAGVVVARSGRDRARRDLRPFTDDPPNAHGMLNSKNVDALVARRAAAGGKIRHHVLGIKMPAPRGYNRVILGGLSVPTGAVVAGAGGLVGARNMVMNRRAKVRKRDDAFLRRYRNRISPKAEEGYQHLREGRNQARSDTIGYGALSAGNAASGAKLLRRHPVMAGASIGSAVVLGRVARERGRKAKRWEDIMESHIRNRAYQRERDGQWGKDRLVETSKAMFPTGLVKPLVRPKSPGYATRAGGIVRRGATTYTRRGSIAGTVGGTR